MRAWEADLQFAQMVQELQNSGQHDIIDMWLARHESQERGSEAQAYVELLTSAGYTTTEARGQAWREAQKEGAAFAHKLGFITEWQVVGPFRCNPGELSNADIPVDAVNLSQKFSTLSGEAGWRQVSVNHPFGLLDLRSLLCSDPWVSAYAACWVQLPGLPVISLRLGSNDGAAVWLDGKPILVADVPRGFQPDQDRVSVPGNGAGWHLLVVKVVNHGNLWNLAVRFTDSVGRPLQIPTRATPPD